MTQTSSAKVLRELFVYMGEDEYGNPRMQELAEGYAREYPEADVICVYEHAGWYMRFARFYDGSLRLVETTNGTVQSSRAVMLWWKSHSKARIVPVDTIRRKDKSEPIRRRRNSKPKGDAGEPRQKSEGSLLSKIVVLVGENSDNLPAVYAQVRRISKKYPAAERYYAYTEDGCALVFARRPTGRLVLVSSTAFTIKVPKRLAIDVWADSRQEQALTMVVVINDGKETFYVT